VLFARVAVPLPLPEPLVYSVPENLAPWLTPGVRVRVPLGRRRVTGIFLGGLAAVEGAFEIRPVEEVLDHEPVLPADLLRLAEFVAEYYLCPIGEVLRSFLPASLPAWGGRKVWLTDAGALASPRGETESRIVQVLHERGRLRVGELRGLVADPGLAQGLAELEARGWIAVAESREKAGGRYQTAVELANQEAAEREAALGRSRLAREVVAYLTAIGRPATLTELAEKVGAGSAIARRLLDRGVLRSFVQVARVDLGHHALPAAAAAPAIELRGDQASALAAVRSALGKKSYHGFLLQGVTGSGKSEVFLRAAADCLESGRTAIVMVPEIALVPALAADLRARFASRLAIFHSAMAGGERHQEWERVRRGEARIVLGPRSALFAPLERLGLIVVDEEQDSAYKQDGAPRYSARDLALVRARRAGAVAILTSATPSLESRWNAMQGKLSPLPLTQRVGSAGMPQGILVDLRHEDAAVRVGEAPFSARLREELGRTFERGEQAILLRNRRGFAPLYLCRACGEDFRCADCGLPRTLHRRPAALVCHYCGSRAPLPELACPTCGQASLEPIGSGTERVEDEFKLLFADIAVDVLDRDTVRRKGGAAAILERFAAGEVRCLIGTQMVSKGHHFPNVALAAVLAADSYLCFPDFRAVERTYGLLSQLAGRSGRAAVPGRFLVQTYHPDHYAIRAALDHDDERFAAEEMRFRRAFHYPPFSRMVLIGSHHRSRAAAEAVLGEVARRLEPRMEALAGRIQGPAPAPFEKLRGEWRFHLLVRSPQGEALRQAVREALPDPMPASLSVDVDPQQLL
jgi:primosomal protein N' (replication factor Y)